MGDQALGRYCVADHAVGPYRELLARGEKSLCLAVGQCDDHYAGAPTMTRLAGPGLEAQSAVAATMPRPRRLSLPAAQSQSNAAAIAARPR